MPCRGCRDKLTGIQGNFKMRFVGKPDGKLMKGAPGNYNHGEIYVQPYHLSEFPYWELVDEVPKLTVPPPSESDSVFEDAVFIPDDDAAPVEMNTPPTEVAGVNVDPDAPAIMEPYMKFNTRTGKLSEISTPIVELITPITSIPELEKTVDSVVEEQSEADLGDMEGHATFGNNDVPVEVIPKTRDELKEILTESGIEYNDKARTATLKKMVDELAPKE